MKQKTNKTLRRLIALIFILSMMAPVLSIEPQAYDAAKLDLVRDSEPNLTGKGVKLLIVERSENYDSDSPLLDYQPDIEHPLLKNSNISIPLKEKYNLGNESFHSTAICSIITGKGSVTDENGNQIAYNAPLTDSEIEVLEFNEFLLKHLIDISNTLETDILCASFGTSVPDWWTRALQYIIERDDVLGIASIGNGDEIFDSCLYPASGANFIAVGIADRTMMPSGDNSWLDPTAKSSHGITFEGIIKPDIVASGNYLVADLQNDGIAESGNYSSYAAPAVASIAGLLVQKAKEKQLKYAYSEKGSNCVIKSILMTAASKGVGWHKGQWSPDDDHQSPLDMHQGSGTVNAAEACELLDSEKLEQAVPASKGWDNSVIDGKSENTYSVNVSPQDRYISATLVWNRKFQKEYPFEYLTGDNINLRLELWAQSPEDPNNSLLIDYSDSDNGNVEHLFCPVSSGNVKYEIVVVFSDNENISKIDTQQRYALSFTTSPIPEQWKGQWLDFNADGSIDLNDVQGVLSSVSKQNKQTGISIDTQAFNRIRILLDELSKRDLYK
ncbi:MAG: S8 family serine peptidase [Sedimentisphaeraceae bacterium JB056]